MNAPLRNKPRHFLDLSDHDSTTLKAIIADARKRKRTALLQLEEAWDKFDLLLAPSARGEAPSGLGNTGDPIFNRFWTLLGAPCIALPFNTGPFGLPLSVQLIGRRDRDDRCGLDRDCNRKEPFLKRSESNEHDSATERQYTGNQEADECFDERYCELDG